MRCPRGSDDSSFFIYTPVYIKNELGLFESGLSNPSRRSRQPLLGACALHFVAVGDSAPPFHSVTASRRLLPPCLSTNSYKNELGLFESVTFQPQSAVPTAPVRGMRPPLRCGRRLRSYVTLRHCVAAALAALHSPVYIKK